MADILTLNIPISQSPLPAAVDQFYDFMKTMTGVHSGGPDRIGLLGTIINYDINAKARLYNDYVVRAFSDRTVQTSPVAAQGLGDFADRYSSRYVEMLTLLVGSIDTALSTSDQDKINFQQAIVTAKSTDRDAWLTKIETDWTAQETALGIDPTKIDSDPAIATRYYEQRVLFLKHRNYAATLNQFNNQINAAQGVIDAIYLRSYPDDEARNLALLLKNANQYQTIRPRRPDLEIKYNWDELTIQNPEYTSMLDIFDEGPMVDSIVDPRTILQGGGVRGYSVSTKSTQTNSHDSDWHASGSGSFIPFVSGEFSTNSSSHFTSTLGKIREYSVSFEHVGELAITRGGWFSSTIFSFKRVQDFLKNNKLLAQKLALLTTGLVIGRGLTLKLFFQDTSDVREWGSSSSSGSAGISICGYDLGGSGGSSSSYDNHVVNEADQSVTFKDDSNVCRLLGVRVTPLAVSQSLEQIALGARPFHTLPNLVRAAMLA